MKTLSRTRLIVVTATGLLSVAAGLVFAKPHTPTPTPPPIFKFQLKLKEAHCDCTKYNDALAEWKKKPGHDQHIHYNEWPWNEDCSGNTGTKPNSNVTQHLATQNAKDLIDFLNTAGIQ